MHPNGGMSGVHRPKKPAGALSGGCRQESLDVAQKPDSEITHETSARGDQIPVKLRHRYFPTLAHVASTSLNDGSAWGLLDQPRAQLLLIALAQAPTQFACSLRGKPRRELPATEDSHDAEG